MKKINKPSKMQVAKTSLNGLVGLGIDAVVWNAAKAVTPIGSSVPKIALMRIGTYGLSVAATSIFSRELDDMMTSIGAEVNNNERN